MKIFPSYFRRSNIMIFWLISLMTTLVQDLKIAPRFGNSSRKRGSENLFEFPNRERIVSNNETDFEYRPPVKGKLKRSEANSFIIGKREDKAPSGLPLAAAQTSNVGPIAEPGKSQGSQDPALLQQCLSNPCLNSGTCQPQPFGSTAIFCRCLAGFYGEFCQYDAPECEQRPCQHNGECVKNTATSRGFHCRCPLGFSGEDCEVVLNSNENAVSDQTVAEMTTTKKNRSPISSLFLQWHFLTVAGLVASLLIISVFLSVDSELKALRERIEVLKNHGYEMGTHDVGYFRLIIRKFIHCVCVCGSICPCFENENSLVDITDQQVPLPLLNHGVYPGYTPLPQESVGGGESSPGSTAFSPPPGTIDHRNSATVSMSHG